MPFSLIDSPSPSPSVPRKKAGGAFFTGLDEKVSLSLARLLFMAIHVPLALLMYRSQAIASTHAIITFAIALAVALGRRTALVFAVAAYIVGAEVLWRLTHAAVPWEYGKYAVVATLLLAMSHMRGLRWRPILLLYLLPLLPAIVLTVGDLGADEARQYVSFNLSGPLALAVCVWFGSQVCLTRREMQTVLTALIAPVAGVAAITITATYTNPDIAFATQSNFASSGGFGPNQVSAMLGLAAMLAFFQLINRRLSIAWRACMFAVLIVMAVQSALTFSRGGLYGALGAVAVGTLYLLRDSRTRIAFILGAVSVLLTAEYVILPRLEEFTAGALSQRFEELDTSNRRSILVEDLRVFREHFVVGVGPGRARDYRNLDPAAAHTEFTRELAEHGLLGFVALCALATIAIQAIRVAERRPAKAFAAALVAWSMLFMAHSSMRLAAPAFILGLACVGEAKQAKSLVRRASRSPSIRPVTAVESFR